MFLCYSEPLVHSQHLSEDFDIAVWSDFTLVIIANSVYISSVSTPSNHSTSHSHSTTYSFALMGHLQLRNTFHFGLKIYCSSLRSFTIEFPLPHSLFHTPHLSFTLILSSEPQPTSDFHLPFSFFPSSVHACTLLTWKISPTISASIRKWAFMQYVSA
jgi:hypothetical protein